MGPAEYTAAMAVLMGIGEEGEGWEMLPIAYSLSLDLFKL